MNAWETLWNPIVKSTIEVLVESSKTLNDIKTEYLATAAKAKSAIQEIKKTGVEIPLSEIFGPETKTSIDDSKKEIVLPTIQEKTPPVKSRRKKHSTAETTVNKIKTEKTSITAGSLVKITEEPDKIMPVPSKPDPKKGKLQVKQEKIESKSVRRSNRTKKPSVMVVESPVPVIDLSDSVNESMYETSEEIKFQNSELEETLTLNQPETQLEPENKPSNINVTVVIHKDTFTPDLLTDDESVEETLTKTSLYENTPVKKRVEAMKKVASSEISKLPIREMSKTTPSKFQPTMTSTAKFPKNLPAVSHSNSSLLNLAQKEALLKKMEEKKRKREEQQLKVQQQRETMLEKERLKTLEAQRLKEERHNQLLAEREVRQLKNKMKMEKKKNITKMKVIEENKEEEQKPQKQKRNVQTVPVPIYMTTEAPLLPSDDCFDSDADQSKPDLTSPKWARREVVTKQLLTLYQAQDQVKNTFFCRQASTVDLEDIFEVISHKKLKRSSSALWHKKPRFTMIPLLNEGAE